MRPVGERRLPRWSELSEVVRPRGPSGDATGRRLARAAPIGDLRSMARRRAPRAVFDYTDGAAGDGDQPAPVAGGVRRGWSSGPRVLQDVSAVDTATTLLGRPVGAAAGVRARPGSPG